MTSPQTTINPSTFMKENINSTLEIAGLRNEFICDWKNMYCFCFLHEWLQNICTWVQICPNIIFGNVNLNF